mmetsp:Transcript_678/g.1477  ORF Transcript_678/g.1477 Transcript_678/m.1477 type:complete len:234 (+) Transcript_678:772-1473(+)
MGAAFGGARAAQWLRQQTARDPAASAAAPALQRGGGGYRCSEGSVGNAATGRLALSSSRRLLGPRGHTHAGPQSASCPCSGAAELVVRRRPRRQFHLRAGRLGGTGLPSGRGVVRGGGDGAGREDGDIPLDVGGADPAPRGSADLPAQQRAVPVLLGRVQDVARGRQLRCCCGGAHVRGLGGRVPGGRGRLAGLLGRRVGGREHRGREGGRGPLHGSLALALEEQGFGLAAQR